jgi:hypothetical protein
VDNFGCQLDAAAAGAELVEPVLESFDDAELDFSDEEEDTVADSELLAEPFVELLADSRLSVR